MYLGWICITFLRVSPLPTIGEKAILSICFSDLMFLASRMNNIGLYACYAIIKRFYDPKILRVPKKKYFHSEVIKKSEKGLGCLQWIFLCRGRMDGRNNKHDMEMMMRTMEKCGRTQGQKVLFCGGGGSIYKSYCYYIAINNGAGVASTCAKKSYMIC